VLRKLSFSARVAKQRGWNACLCDCAYPPEGVDLDQIRRAAFGCQLLMHVNNCVRQTPNMEYVIDRVN